MLTFRDRQARRATFVVFAVQGLSFATLLVQVENLRARHGLSEGELTLLLLVVPLLAGAGSELAGKLASRLSSKTVLRFAQPAVALGVVAAGFATSVPLLLPALVLFGLAVGAVDAGMNMQGVAVERRYARPVLNGFHCLWSAASVAGALWASGAAGLPMGVTMAIPMILALAGSLYAGPQLCTADEERVVAAAPAGRFPWKPIIPLCMAMAFLYVGDAAISNFSTVYMSDVLSANAAVIPLAYAAYQATTLLVRLGGDVAVRRYGPAAIVRIGGAVATAGFAGIVFAPTQPLAIAAFALTGVGLAVVAPQSFSAAGRLDPGGTGVAIARVNLFNYVGFIVGAALVGGLADAAGMRAAFAAPLVLAAAIIVLAPGFQPTTSRSGPASPKPV
ncbi:MFS transporter [Nonomuraea soli]|uniref:Sugar phosphate permease n=1 Tax=Nonomuraea soli TaxID=1032476 RepID=A0A7W0CR90_9ACTN|nr:MFS transporter [Nonomuraea soli]MBA2895700.1 sugar phosphate permease [Nonomuraea soli]